VRLSDIHIGSNPIVRCRSVALATKVFCEEYVTGTKSHAGSVAESNVDGTRESYDPTTVRCTVPTDNMGREIISKKKPCGWARGVKKGR
jgi:hypothetical protein